MTVLFGQKSRHQEQAINRSKIMQKNIGLRLCSQRGFLGAESCSLAS
jgi:hypothetical protein